MNSTPLTSRPNHKHQTLHQGKGAKSAAKEPAAKRARSEDPAGGSAKVLFRSKVDKFIPRSQHVNLKIVGQSTKLTRSEDPTGGSAKVQGYLAHKKHSPP